MVSYPCLNCQERAGAYLFTEVKEAQTPYSFWWLASCRGQVSAEAGTGPPTSSYLQKPCYSRSGPPLWALHLSWVAGIQHSANGATGLVNSRQQLTSLGVSGQLGIAPLGEAQKTLAGTERARSHRRAHRFHRSKLALDATFMHSLEPSSHHPVRWEQILSARLAAGPEAPLASLLCGRIPGAVTEYLWRFREASFPNSRKASNVPEQAGIFANYLLPFCWALPLGEAQH